MNTPDEPYCIERIARRHDAFARVFNVFPERVDMNVDGYIATTCNEIGKRYTLYVSGNEYNVVVADCKNRSEPKTYEPLDVDYRIWYDAHIPNAPTKVLLCE